MNARSAIVCLTLLGVTLSPRAGHAGAGDPVDHVQQALRSLGRNPTAEDLARRKNALEQSVKPLTFPELARVLALGEWHDLARDPAVEAVDEPVRRTLIARFEKEVRDRLRTGSPEGRQALLTLLGELGREVRGHEPWPPLASAFGPEIAEFLAQPPGPLREAAARALGTVFPDPQLARNALGKLLTDKDDASRRAAADGMVGLAKTLEELVSRESTQGPSAEHGKVIGAMHETVATLAAQACQDKTPTVRRAGLQAAALAAKVATKQFAPDLPEPGAEPAVLPERGPERDELRRKLAAERERLLPFAVALNRLPPVVVPLLRDADDDIRVAGCAALEPLAGVRRRLSWEVLALRAFAEPAVNEVPNPLEKVPAAAPALAALLRDREVRVRLAAIYVLETLGPEAVAAAADLVKALANEDPFVRWGCARAIGKFAPAEAVVTVPALARALEDPIGDVRVTALAALERYGSAARPVAEGLGRAVKHPDVATRQWAMRVLANLGPDAAPAMPALLAALSAPEPSVRVAAARTLGKIGPKAQPAVEPLRKTLVDTDAMVRRAAAEALLSLVPK